MVVGRGVRERRDSSSADAHQHGTAGRLRVQGAGGYAKVAVLTEVIVGERVRADRRTGGSSSREQEQGGED